MQVCVRAGLGWPQVSDALLHLHDVTAEAFAGRSPQTMPHSGSLRNSSKLCRVLHMQSYFKSVSRRHPQRHAMLCEIMHVRTVMLTKGRSGCIVHNDSDDLQVFQRITYRVC